MGFVLILLAFALFMSGFQSLCTIDLLPSHSDRSDIGIVLAI